MFLHQDTSSYWVTSGAYLVRAGGLVCDSDVSTGFVTSLASFVLEHGCDVMTQSDALQQAQDAAFSYCVHAHTIHVLKNRLHHHAATTLHSTLTASCTRLATVRLIRGAPPRDVAAAGASLSAAGRAYDDFRLLTTYRHENQQLKVR